MTIPFALSHNSGMTISVYDHIVRLLENGNNFSVIEKILSSSFVDTFTRKQLMYPDKEFPAISNLFRTFSPSDDLIKKCFVRYYERFHSRYVNEVNKIEFKHLSCDHTFKVTANIGYIREGKWCKQYDSVFLVLNEHGKCKGFEFTKGTGFEHVHELMKQLSQQPYKCSHIFIDNCCDWRLKIRNVFPDVLVKLNLFHAIKRLTNALPKKHPFFDDVCKEIGLVFRKSGDFLEERQEATPEPKEIITNMVSFVSKWNDIHHNGWRIVTHEFLSEVEKLNSHINLGCVSDIPKGAGTNRIESLYKQLKPLITRGRLGVQTAKAIFTHIMYYQNSKNGTMKFVPPVRSLKPPQPEQKAPHVNPLESPNNEIDVDMAYHFIQSNWLETPGDHGYCQYTVGRYNLSKVHIKIYTIYGKI